MFGYHSEQKVQVCTARKSFFLQREVTQPLSGLLQAYSRLDCLLLTATLTIEEAQIAVPPERNDVDDKDAMLKRHDLEVDELHPRPDHPVLHDGCFICALQLLLRRGALHDGHRREETEEVCGREDELVGCDAGDCCRGGLCVAANDYPLLEELEPCCCRGAEDC
jgi:hypothetical protein